MLPDGKALLLLLLLFCGRRFTARLPQNTPKKLKRALMSTLFFCCNPFLTVSQQQEKTFTINSASKTKRKTASKQELENVTVIVQ